MRESKKIVETCASILWKLQNKVGKKAELRVRDGEYRDETGVLRCKKCGENCSIKIGDIEHRCACRCETEEEQKSEEMRKQAERMKRIRKNREWSLMGKRYACACFENNEMISENFEYAHNRCRKFCECVQSCLENGIGLYLWGTKGTGKTRLSACVANWLLDHEYTVLFTNFSEISKKIRHTYSVGFKSDQTEYQILLQLAKVDFLFIDDLGVERVFGGGENLWLQEKVYDVVNTRYNNNAPIIYTSNYSLRQLAIERGVDDRTVDRIKETCEIVKFEGASFRKKVTIGE